MSGTGEKTTSRRATTPAKPKAAATSSPPVLKNAAAAYRPIGIYLGPEAGQDPVQARVDAAVAKHNAQVRERQAATLAAARKARGLEG